MKRGKLIAFRRRDEAELSDEALIAGCAVGDLTALGTLFDRHYPAIHGFLSRVSGARADELDDIVQATFLEISRGAARYGGRSAVRTWIFGVAANLARRHRRTETRRRALLVRAAELPHDLPVRPDETAEARELAGRLNAALAELPHDLRVVFVICDLEEVPGAEAARVLGVREGTLGRRLHEARKALRAVILGGGP